MPPTTHDHKSLSGFRRIRLLAGKFAFLAFAALAAGAAWGGTLTINGDRNTYSASDGSIWWNTPNLEGWIGSDGKIATGLALRYEGSSSERTFDFWLKFGLIGDSVTNVVKLQSVSKTSADYIFWGGDSEGYSSHTVPGLSPVPYTVPQVWYSVVFSNATYKGVSPVPAENDLTVETAELRVSRVWTGSALDDGVEDDRKGDVILGLGQNGSELAVVFRQTFTWTPPANLTNVQFLVVGGGGGGGGGTWGPGGGGGGVVTGIVHSISRNAQVTATVGAGGASGKTNGAQGTAGGNSLLAVDGATYVTAYGGGANGTKRVGGSGGSGSGGGAQSGTLRAGGSATRGTFDATKVAGETFGNAGGSNGSSQYCSGGGGGATQTGGNGSSSTGGKGGEGLACDITGTSSVYGSGGGGGGSSTRGAGGTNAGNGSYNANANASKYKATAGAANAGGGGGGGGKNNNTYVPGGAGGSGVIILRFSLDASEAQVPIVASKQYTGETLTADIVASDGYTIDENDGGVDVGTYDVVITLNAGYHWAEDGLTDTITLPFAITLATNAWTSEPAITKASWTTDVDEPGILTAGETRFGTVSATITKDGGEAEPFDGTLPTEAGEYVITYTAPSGTANYTAPETLVKSVSFTVFSADAIPPYEMTIGTLSVGTDRTLSVPYSFACDVTTAKTADLYARYALDGDTTTNTAQIATGVALGGGNGTGTVADLKPGATYWVDVYAEVDNEASAPTALASVTVPGPASDLTASATFTPIPMEFIISGSVTPGLGTTTVTVKWSLNNANSYDETATFTFAFGDDGTFSTNIAHSSLTDTLTWQVTAPNTVTTATWGELVLDGPAPIDATTQCQDTYRVTYTWTGLGGDNLWTNVLNWSGVNMSDELPDDECYGYPGTRGRWGFSSFVKFVSDAEVDLEGAKYGFIDDGGFLIDPNVTVLLRNGTLDLHRTDYTLGASGSTLLFDRITIVRSNEAWTQDTNGQPVLNFATGSSTVFAGTTTATWMFRPTNADVVLIFRDGTTSSRYSTSTSIKSTTFTTISNAVWRITTDNVTAGTGYVTYFRTGADRQAQLKTGTGQSIDLRYTYDIVIPKEGLALPSIEAGYITDDTNAGTFRIDVTDYGKKAWIPLVKFTNTTAANQANNNTRVTSQISGEKLVVQAIDRGKDVTEKRNARLVWDNATQTIYYEQDYTAGTIFVVQ